MTYRLYMAGILQTTPNAAITIETSPQISFLFDPANTDAVEFAKWMKEGNKPEPAVEGEVVTDEWVSETIAKLLPNG